MSSCIWTTPRFRLNTRKGHTLLMCGTEFWLFRGGKCYNISESLEFSRVVSKKLILASKRVLLRWQEQHQSEIQLVDGSVFSESHPQLAEPPSQLNSRLNIHTHTRWWTHWPRAGESLSATTGLYLTDPLYQSKKVINKLANREEKMSWPIPDWVFSSTSHPQLFAGLLCRDTHLSVLTSGSKPGSLHTMVSFGEVHVDN